MIADVTILVGKLQTIKRDTMPSYAQNATKLELSVSDEKFLDKILSIVKTVDDTSPKEVSPWRSENLASEIKYLSSQSTTNRDTIFFISNKLSKQVCKNAMKVSPNVKWMETGDKLLHNKIILLYPNRTTFAAFKTQMENNCENSIHHILHVVCCVDKEYEILAWKSTAEPQTFDTHRYLAPDLRDVLNKILGA